MVDMQDQIHFLTHTRVDIPHRLLVATLIVSAILSRILLKKICLGLG